jgi:menaquinone-dependent protoporphyrinogen oxidase
MQEHILIAYATCTGSTSEVAAVIGEELSQSGYRVDVLPIVENPRLDPRADYRAVLIGSAVQYGTWLQEAVEYVNTNQAKLMNVPVGLFCVHIQNTGDDEVSRRKRFAYLDAVRPMVSPAAEAYFAGRFNRHGAALLMPGWAARFVPQMDQRDWNKIRAWGQYLGTPRFTAKTKQGV